MKETGMVSSVGLAFMFYRVKLSVLSLAIYHWTPRNTGPEVWLQFDHVVTKV